MAISEQDPAGQEHCRDIHLQNTLPAEYFSRDSVTADPSDATLKPDNQLPTEDFMATQGHVSNFKCTDSRPHH